MEKRLASRLTTPHRGGRRAHRRGLSFWNQHPRIRRALAAAFAAPVGKDVVSRTTRKVKGDWDAWNARPLGDEPIVRLIADGTVVRVRLDRRATSISLLVALAVRADGQKVLLAIRSMGGESEAACRALLDDLVKRGLRTPGLVIADGAPGLEKALAALWPEAPVQRCTVGSLKNPWPDDSLTLANHHQSGEAKLGRKERDQLALFISGSLRQLVPDNHVLARVDRVLDLSWLRAEVAEWYCDEEGRPGIDPEVAVRLMLAGLLVGVVHDRKLMREAASISPSASLSATGCTKSYPIIRA
jgi:hypothetical protein